MTTQPAQPVELVRTPWDEDAPHIWVGCLACYNEGRLAGEWFMAIDGDNIHPDHLHPKNFSPMYPHEELWCLDQENFHGLITGECSPMEAAAAARFIEAVQETAGQSDVPWQVMVRLIGNLDPGRAQDDESRLQTVAQYIEDAYLGCGDLADLVEEHYSNSLPPDLIERLEEVGLWGCIDWKSKARDWAISHIEIHWEGTSYWFQQL